jgi:hypothetical protein
MASAAAGQPAPMAHRAFTQECERSKAPLSAACEYSLRSASDPMTNGIYCVERDMVRCRWLEPHSYLQ